MFTILVVGPEEAALEAAGVARPSIEVLRARGAEDAIEKLGRNRRIDAVLLLGPDASEAAREIHEENPAGPPLFAAGAEAGAAPGVTYLGDATPEALIDHIVARLE
jgi:hypothetical protein